MADPRAAPETTEHAQEVVCAAWKALERVVMVPGSPDKRFRRDMGGRTDLTSRQFDYLRRLVNRYRRQIGEAEAERHGTALKGLQDGGLYDEP